jgi:hypothetical protein
VSKSASGVVFVNKQRWYDQDPTISMSFSLLERTGKSNQDKASHYIVSLMEAEGIFKKYFKHDPAKLHYLFPANRRKQFSAAAQRLVELMKELPQLVQLEYSLCLMNYIYLLESGIDLNEPIEGLTESFQAMAITG